MLLQAFLDGNDFLLLLLLLYSWHELLLPGSTGRKSECDRQLAYPITIQVLQPFPNTFNGLFIRWRPATNRKDLRNISLLLTRVIESSKQKVHFIFYYDSWTEKRSLPLKHERKHSFQCFWNILFEGMERIKVSGPEAQRFSSTNSEALHCTAGHQQDSNGRTMTYSSRMHILTEWLVRGVSRS